MFQRIVLGLGLIVTAYISVRALSAPEDVLASFGLIVDGADGRNEIRGQYGGFFGAVAVVMVLSLFGRLTERFGLSLLLITVGGVLAGRVLSIVIEGPAILSTYSSGIKILIIADIALVLLTLIALRQSSTKSK